MKEANNVAETHPAPANPPQDDLIDFGEGDAPTPTPAKADKPESTPTPDEIEKMLTSTGKPAEGPLIDFTQELKKDLPS